MSLQHKTISKSAHLDNSIIPLQQYQISKFNENIIAFRQHVWQPVDYKLDFNIGNNRIWNFKLDFNTSYNRIWKIIIVFGLKLKSYYLVWIEDENRE